MLKYDLLIVGSGPAGIQAALRARQAGAAVAVIERQKLVGGSCIHSGTIPSKTLRQAVIDLSGFRHWGLYEEGPRPRPRLPMDTLRARFLQVVAAEVRFQERLLDARGIDSIVGEARFADPHVISVLGPDGPREVRGERILLAAGSLPLRPDDVPFDGVHVLDSDQLLRIEELPRSLIVVGGGVIGSEYAAIFSLLDVDVTLVNRASHLMPFVDETILAALESLLEARGVTLLLEAEVATIGSTGRAARLVLRDGREREADALLFAAGRKGAAATLCLEAAGLAANARGCLEVDGDFRTSVPHIFAAGDVIGFPSLASVSREQGRVAAARALGVPCRPVAGLLPYGIWTVPEIAMVGLTEQDARRQGIEVVTGLGRYEDTARGQIIGDRTGLLKLVVERSTGKILGAHILGTGGAELIHLAQMAVEHGMEYLVFIRMVMNYPTLSRAYKVAAWEVWEQIGD